VGFDTSTFNITLAWIEYINRLAGMLTGLLILITALLAIKNFRGAKHILIPSMLAAILVAVQGWYGSVVVKSQLMPATVSIHLLLALIIVSLLVYVTYGSYHLSSSSINTSRPEKKWLLILWLIAIIQILMGTGIRSSVEVLWEQFPLLQAGEVLGRVGVINYLHTFLGILLAIGTGLAGHRILKIKTISLLSKQSVWLLNILIGLQIIIGINLHVLGLPPILQVFHLWIASVFIGALLVLYTDLKYEQVQNG
jgi:cytochrome c oxidase assembly protein subunit 15